MYFYCRNSLLKRSTQTKSSQPKTNPRALTTIHTTSRIIPPLLTEVLHLTTSSTIQFTPGIRSKSSCTKRHCLLNQVITFPPCLLKFAFIQKEEAFPGMGKDLFFVYHDGNYANTGLFPVVQINRAHSRREIIMDAIIAPIMLPIFRTEQEDAATERTAEVV